MSSSKVLQLLCKLYFPYENGGVLAINYLCETTGIVLSRCSSRVAA